MDIRDILASEYLAQPETMALLQAHWQEIAVNKDVMVLKPDVERYALMEKAGTLFSLGAFLGDRLIGYSVNLIGPHLHYSDLVYVSNDVLFVAQEYRNSRYGLHLIHATERRAREYGAAMMVWHAKDRTNLEIILRDLGYATQDVLLSKVL